MHEGQCNRVGCHQIRSQFGLFLRSQRAPHFDGKAFCSEACLQSHVEQELVLRRKRASDYKKTLLRRKPIGSILLQSEIVTSDQLLCAVKLQRQCNEGRVGEWLARLGFIEESQLTTALARQYGLPWINLKNSSVAKEALRMVPGNVARLANLLPIGYDRQESAIRVVVAAPVDFLTHDAIRRMLQRDLLPYVGDQTSIQSLIEQCYGYMPAADLRGRLKNHPQDIPSISRKIVASASAAKAENFQLETIADCIWLRLYLGDREEDLFFETLSENSSETLPLAQQFIPASNY